MVKVKICGITNIEDGLYASSCGADALGFIFSPKSPRFLTLKQAKKIIPLLDVFVAKVGVFVDEKKDIVLKYVQELGLDVLQFHGEETPAYCRFFKRRYRVIKAVFPHEKGWEEKIKDYDVHAYLFDVKWEAKTAGNKRFSIKEVKKYLHLLQGKRVIASGGLDAENVQEVIRQLDPYAVDVSSGVEKMAGLKDKKKVNDFIKRAKYAVSR